MNIKQVKQEPKHVAEVLKDKITIELTRGELIDLLAARLTTDEMELYGSVLNGMLGAEVSTLLYSGAGLGADTAATELEHITKPIKEASKEFIMFL
ncbi:hypothetical protein LD13_gp012 [Bacillus phage Bobb]|uniref:Uncharacterized protein n=1 Tax=Bacillus phage Bobb TaxID=1527469 RepID=A0A076G8K5_9CAUD|nr:hypothetical protein LD13_gp012 [Bacillus phage Bobb]AII27913.1 hypothetical protein [Bacillus phage Bobb]